MIIRSDLNLCIEKGIFPSNLKNADITPIFKKLDRLQTSKHFTNLIEDLRKTIIPTNV